MGHFRVFFNYLNTNDDENLIRGYSIHHLPFSFLLISFFGNIEVWKFLRLENFSPRVSYFFDELSPSFL